MLDTKIFCAALTGLTFGVNSFIAQVTPEAVEAGPSHAALQLLLSNANSISVAVILIMGVRWLDQRLKEKETESKENIAAARERYSKRETDLTALAVAERDKTIARYEALLVAQQNRYDEDVKLLRSRHDQTIVEIKTHFARELLELKSQNDKLLDTLTERK